MAIPIKAQTFTLAANGGANGVLDITSNADAFPGARCWLVSDAVPAIEGRIVSLVGDDSVVFRADTARSRTGHTPATAYLTTNNARLIVPAQVVSTRPAFSKLQQSFI